MISSSRSQIVCSCQWSDLTRGGALHPLMLQMGRKAVQTWSSQRLMIQRSGLLENKHTGSKLLNVIFYLKSLSFLLILHTSQSFKRWCFMTLWSDYLGIGGLWNTLLSGVGSEICCIISQCFICLTNTLFVHIICVSWSLFGICIQTFDLSSKT